MATPPAVVSASLGTAFADGVPDPIAQFLQVPSSSLWAHALSQDLPTLLNDHANCELKAASTAISMLHRYGQHDALVYRMSRLAREEMRHFEQVRKLMKQRGIGYRTLSASAYARGLHEQLAANEPGKLVDTLITGALIEARSCERFALIAPLLDGSLGDFYRGLLASEARHFEHYLELARTFAKNSIDARIDALRAAEQRLIAQPASALRFHSGPPAPASASEAIH